MIRAWLKERLRRLRVAWALRVGRHPEQLPNPALGPFEGDARRAVEQLETVGLFLGPYRNLTTLSAAILFLHPECQVLNHAGVRILDYPERNFLVETSDDKFKAFCHFALTMSQGGARGRYGGSIMLAHAYADHSPIRAAYLSRFGAKLQKPKARSLVWKESQRVTHVLRSGATDLSELMEKNPKLRFLLPIRNPIDTAHSIARIGMTRVYGEKPRGKVLDVIDMVLNDMQWFLEWEMRYPERFFHFYQNRLNDETLRTLAAFLHILPDSRWIENTLAIYRLRAPYDYDKGVRVHYEKRVKQIFHRQPDIYTQFMSFVDPTENARQEG